VLHPGCKVKVRLGVGQAFQPALAIGLRQQLPVHKNSTRSFLAWFMAAILSAFLEMWASSGGLWGER